MDYIKGLCDRLKDIAYHTKNKYETSTILEAATALRQLEKERDAARHWKTVEAEKYELVRILRYRITELEGAIRRQNPGWTDEAIEKFLALDASSEPK